MKQQELEDEVRLLLSFVSSLVCWIDPANARFKGKEEIVSEFYSINQSLCELINLIEKNRE